MSAFFVGQRVKKVRGNVGVGITGRVVSLDASEYNNADLIVRIDAAVVNLSGDVFAPGECCGVKRAQWEPILPSGHRPAELTVEELLPFLNERAAA